ncbi:MAG: DNA internalization-related competence protein ComEC/Rec2 [Longimicrobiales bacterium]
MSRAPPVLRVASVFAAGVTLGPAAPVALTGSLSTALLITCLILLWQGLGRRFWPLPCFIAGVVWALGASVASNPACLAALEDGASLDVTGYFTSARLRGMSRFHVLSGVGPGCEAPVGVFLRSSTGVPPEGEYGRLRGRWLGSLRSGAARGPGVVSGASFRPDPQVGGVPWGVGARARLTEPVLDALDLRFGARAGTAAALTVAESGGVSPELREAFVRAGAAHMLSISGFHVGVVAGLVAAIALALGAPPKRRALMVALCVWLYVLAIGAPTSAARAAWMTTALLFGTLRGTPTQALGSLGATMLFLAVMTPGAVARPGYQLTIAGTAGIMVLGGWIRRHWPSASRLAWLKAPVSATVGATAFTAPVLAFHFGQVSLVALASSLVLTPLVATAIPGVLVVLALDLSGLPGAGMLAYSVDGVLIALEWGVRLFAQLPGASVSVTGFETVLFLLGGAIPWTLWVSPWKIKPLLRVWTVACTAFATVFVGKSVRDLAQRNEVEVVAIDVGQGDAIAIRSPRGRWVLVDAGPRTRSFDAGASRVVPFLVERDVPRLEAVLLTHPDEDHAGGMASVLAAVPTKAVLGPGRTAGQSGQARALALARDAGIPWRRVVAGDRWELDGMDFRILHPVGSGDEGAPNDWSVVLLVSWGEFDVLLTGDADVAIERGVLNALPDEINEIEVLKVGHHGSRTSTSRELLDRARPTVAMISVGRRNRYGHPSPGVLRRLEQAGVTILRTDLGGMVRVTGRKDGTVVVKGQGWRP